ncbi:MAG: hypothetical protein HW394_1446 [Acidobacteria bacterium]|nr:hypothetical protein [Acidobacteriota bacterium]
MRMHGVGILRPASGASLVLETAKLREIPLRVDERRLESQRPLKLIDSGVELAKLRGLKDQ